MLALGFITIQGVAERSCKIERVSSIHRYTLYRVPQRGTKELKKVHLNTVITL